MSVYRDWLSDVVDTNDVHCAAALDFMSQFHELEYKTLDQCAEYAIMWCRLSTFLWRNRRKQLYSSRVDMQFSSGPTSSSNVYWFEVLNAAVVHATKCVAYACETLQTQRVNAAKPSFGLMIISYAHLQLDTVLNQVRSAIGVCDYVETKLATLCPFVENKGTIKFLDVTKLHQTLTLIGLWLNARKSMLSKDYKQARDLLATMDLIATADQSTRESGYFVQSIQLFDFVCLIEASVLDNKRGLAVGHARAANIELHLECEREYTNALVADITSDPTRMPPVPSPGHALLKHTSNPNIMWLQQGDNPLTESQRTFIIHSSNFSKDKK